MAKDKVKIEGNTISGTAEDVIELLTEPKKYLRKLKR